MVDAESPKNRAIVSSMEPLLQHPRVMQEVSHVVGVDGGFQVVFRPGVDAQKLLHYVLANATFQDGPRETHIELSNATTHHIPSQSAASQTPQESPNTQDAPQHHA